jgi:hypothetical protein
MHTNTNHSPYSLSQQEIFLQLSAAQFLALLLQENAESFVTLDLLYHVGYFVGFTRIRLQEP